MCSLLEETHGGLQGWHVQRPRGRKGIDRLCWATDRPAPMCDNETVLCADRLVSSITGTKGPAGFPRWLEWAALGEGVSVPRHMPSTAPALVIAFAPSVPLEFTWRRIRNVAAHRSEHASEHFLSLSWGFTPFPRLTLNCYAEVTSCLGPLGLSVFIFLVCFATGTYSFFFN